MSCPKCFQQKIGRGIPHKCTDANKKQNIADLVKQQEGKEQILSEVLKSVVDEKTGGENKEVKLTQMKGGSDLTISLGKRKSKDSGTVDAEVAAKLKKSLDLSQRDTKKMLNILRKGNVKVESNVNEILEEIGKELEEEYEDVKMVFEKTETEKSEEKSKKTKKKKVIVKAEISVTVARDAAGLVKKVAEARGISLDNLKNRVVIDGGQGSLKVCVCVCFSCAWALARSL